MPIAILVQDLGSSPRIFDGSTDQNLLQTLHDQAGAPSMGAASEAAVWLMQYPYPSGWYLSREEAEARLARDRSPTTMEHNEFVDIRAELNLSRAAFAEMLGFGGSANTRHKQIWEMEKARKPIMPERARLARTLITLHRLRGASK